MPFRGCAPRQNGRATPRPAASRSLFDARHDRQLRQRHRQTAHVCGLCVVSFLLFFFFSSSCAVRCNQPSSSYYKTSTTGKPHFIQGASAKVAVGAAQASQVTTTASAHSVGSSCCPFSGPWCVRTLPTQPDTHRWVGTHQPHKRSVGGRK